MRLAVLWLTILLIGVPSSWITQAERQPVASRGEYVDHHLIVRFKPGVPIPLNNLVPAHRIQRGNQALDELKTTSALSQVERLAPYLPPPAAGFDAALRATAQRAPKSLAEVAAIWHQYGQDRSVLLRFARPIDPPRLADDLMRRYPHLVEFAEPDYIERVTVIPNDPRFSQQWHLRHRIDAARRADIRAPEAWDITTGSPEVVIAVIDAGVDTGHPDLANNVFVNPGEIPNNGLDDDGNGFVDDVSGWDFTRRDNDPNDESGHGSWMSGVAVAETNNALEVAGVSWNSRVLPLKAGDAMGIFLSQQVQAINYAIAMAPHGVRVINMSFGGPISSRERELALRAANEARITAIAASGNGGGDSIGDNNDESPFYPSNFSLTLDNVVAVAATDRLNQLAGFSNFGPDSVDIGAPGVSILSLTSQNPLVPLGNAIGVVSGDGTSPATAIVSGVAALIYSEFPEITPLEVKRRLRGSVDRSLALLPFTFSGGRVNAFRALERDEVPPAPITDLRLVEGASPLMLTWTATGDDGQEGQAMFYEIRYLTEPITPSNLRFAQRVNGPFPQPAGTTETVAVPAKLSPGTHYFLLHVFDNVGNMTESNQLEVVIPG